MKLNDHRILYLSFVSVWQWRIFFAVHIPFPSGTSNGSIAFRVLSTIGMIWQIHVTIMFYECLITVVCRFPSKSTEWRWQIALNAQSIIENVWFTFHLNLVQEIGAALHEAQSDIRPATSINYYLLFVRIQLIRNSLCHSIAVVDEEPSSKAWNEMKWIRGSYYKQIRQTVIYSCKM